MSWKKYGGINQLEQLNNLNVNSLVVDNLSVRNTYQGNFTICGELLISSNAYFDKDVDILGNTYIESNASIESSLHVGLNADISNNLSVIGNTFLYKPLYLVGTNGQGIIPSANKGTMYFLGDISGVGMNKINPQSTLDICGSTTSVLNVFSNRTTNRNILARNANNYGITLTTDLSKSYIDFFHSDKPITSSGNGGGASLAYDPSGNMTISTENDTIIYSNMAISNRSDNLRSHIKRETVVIYDNSFGTYLPDVYSNNYNPATGTLNTAVFNTGNALSLVGFDSNATTFLNMTNANKGWQWGAGSFPKDLSRNMATTGWTRESDGKYIPTETLVSGNSLVKNRTTIGINTYSPETEKYGMDLNSTLHIHHNEIHLVKDITFEIVSMSFSGDKRYGVAVGSPVNDTLNSYLHYVLYTRDGGETWNLSNIDTIQIGSGSGSSSALIGKTTNFKVYFREYSNVIISCGSNFIYSSKDGGMNWSYLSLTINNNNVPSIFIAENNRLFFSYSQNISEKAGINYYDISVNNYINNTNSINNFIESDFNIYTSHGYNNTLFVAGNGITIYDASSLIQKNTTGKMDVSYNSIYTLDGSYAVAVGNNVISHTKNGGESWNHNNSYTINAKDVFIQDLSHAIIVGDRSTILYTQNGGLQWKTLGLSDINGMGNGNRLLNTLNKISNIKMIDINRFIFSVVTDNFLQGQQNGKTEFYYSYLPNIFNATGSPPVLDISGNMTITGDIHINDSGRLKTNNSEFYLLNNNANTVYFAGDASNIFIGNSTPTGTTYIRHQLDVSENTLLHKDVSVIGIERILNTTNATDISSGSLQVDGGASIKKNIFIGGNAIFYGDISSNGNQILNGNLTINQNTILGSDNSNNTVFLNAKMMGYGNVFLNQNLSIIGDTSINNNLFIGKDISINQNLYLKNNAYINNFLTVNRDTLLNNNLYVANDTSLNGKLFVAGDVSLNGNISLGQDISLNGNLYVSRNEKISGNLWIVGDASFNGNQIVGGNLMINKDQVVNGNSYLYGNTVVGNGTNDTLIVNAASSFITDVSMTNLNISANAKIQNNVSVLGNLNTSGDSTLGNLNASGSLITLGTNSTDVLNINSKTNLNNSLFVNSDISTNGNVFVQTGKNMYVDNIDSLDYYLHSSDVSYSSTLNIANNSSIIKIGRNAGKIEIGRIGCDLQLFGSYSAPIVQPDIHVYLNTLTTTRNASLAGIYIKEGYPATADVSAITFDAAFMITSYDRNKFKFKVPNSDNVVALNVKDLKLESDMNGGILVINRHPISSDINDLDNDIGYNMNVSSYDISNIVIRNRTLSTAKNQVIDSNISILGNMTINQPASHVTNSILDISGTFSQRNGYIIQF